MGSSVSSEPKTRESLREGVRGAWTTTSLAQLSKLAGHWRGPEEQSAPAGTAEGDTIGHGRGVVPSEVVAAWPAKDQVGILVIVG